MTGAHSLIASAFAPHACLYTVVLQCDRTATSGELRRAYHRRALLFHPDKQQQRDGGKEKLKEATLRFQAVSAAYEILTDPGRRALYDATGNLDDSFDVGSRSGPRSGRKTTNEEEEEDQQRWSEFFNSVFREVITTAANAEDESAKYRGSEQEAADVLKFYRLCKGDLDKLLTCVVSGTSQDKARWVADIIEPAVRRGDVERYAALSRTSGLVDTDHEGVGGTKQGSKRRRIRKVPKAAEKKEDDRDGLVDTDDEDHIRDKGKTRSKTSNKPASLSKASMSKKDKMEYRVAKKRKVKKEKEIELAKIIKDKQWGGAGIGVAKHSRPGTFSDSLISSLESKYSAANDGGKRQKSGKKKR